LAIATGHHSRSRTAPPTPAVPKAARSPPSSCQYVTRGRRFAC